MPVPSPQLRTVATADRVEVATTRKFRHLCPYMDEIDNGVITIRWVADGHTIELHSLAAYLDYWAERKVSHEHVTATVRDALSLLEGIAQVEVSTEWATAGMRVTVNVATDDVPR